MRKFILTISLLGGLVPSAWCVPQVLNFQGRLLESGALVNGSRAMTFKIFDAANGGNQLFMESRSVNVSTGVFNVLVGDATTGGIPLSVFDGGDRYIEVQVGAQTLLRQRVVSVGYSFKSQSAAFAVESSTAVFAQRAAVADSVSGNAAVNAATITATTISASGRMGIGTNAPAASLDVVGGAQFGAGAAKSTFSAAGALTFPASYAPAAPQDAATKAYVDAKAPADSGWTKTSKVVALTDPTDRAVVQSTLTVSGNIGVGISVPTARLDVAGAIEYRAKSWLRFTRKEVISSDEVAKNAQCGAELGSDYIAASPAEFIMFQATELDDPNFFIGLAGQPNRMPLSFSGNTSPGLAPVACIHRIAPFRSVNIQFFGGLLDEQKDAGCSGQFGTRYKAATRADAMALPGLKKFYTFVVAGSGVPWTSSGGALHFCNCNFGNLMCVHD